MTHRKAALSVLFSCLAGVLTLGATTATADTYTSGTFSQTFGLTYTTPQTDAATGFNLDIKTSDPAAPGQKPKRATNLKIRFPQGLALDTSAVATCTASDQEIVSSGGSACAAGSKLGTGSAVVNAAPFASHVPEKVTAFNTANGLIIFLQKLPTELLGRDVVLRGSLTDSSSGAVLNVPLPKVEAAAGIASVFTEFKLNVPPTVSGNKTYARTPTVCPDSAWVTTADFTYEDNTTATITSKTSCTS